MGVHRPDGSLVWLRVSAQPTFDALGESTGVLAVFEDITKHIETQRALASTSAVAERTETELRILAECISIGIYRADRSGRCTYANGRWFELYGIDADDTDAFDWRRSIHPDDLERVAEEVRVAASRDDPFESSFRVRTPSTTERWVRATASPVHSATGAIDGFVGSVEDITERRFADVAIAANSARLARSNDELAEFASVAAHDLAEPLRVIEGYLHVLRTRCGSQLDDSARSYIAHAVAGAERLQHLIDDLLRYSRATTESAPMETLDLAPVVKAAADALTVRLAETGARLTVGALPTVVGNRIQLEQLFQNLLANAMKFTRAGVVPMIEVSTIETDGGCQIDVTDNGIGIAPQYRERVFGMFKRLNGRSDYPGTGIGLAICRKVIESHGGRIWVADSETGATMRLLIPSNRASPVEAIA